MEVIPCSSIIIILNYKKLISTLMIFLLTLNYLILISTLKLMDSNRLMQMNLDSTVILITRKMENQYFCISNHQTLI